MTSWIMRLAVPSGNARSPIFMSRSPATHARSWAKHTDHFADAGLQERHFLRFSYRYTRTSVISYQPPLRSGKWAFLLVHLVAGADFAGSDAAKMVDSVLETDESQVLSPPLPFMMLSMCQRRVNDECYERLGEGVKTLTLVSD